MSVKVDRAWRGFAVLAFAAGLLVVSVFGLAQLIVRETPIFRLGLEEAEPTPNDEGPLDFVPTAIGGQLEVTGDRVGTVELTRFVHQNGDALRLSASTTEILLETAPTTLAEMYFEDLAFFPEVEACNFEEGRTNESDGLVALQITCGSLVDIRGNGSVGVHGYLAIPAGMVAAVEIPETGGSVMVGDEAWRFDDAQLLAGEMFGDEPSLSLDAGGGRALSILYDPHLGTMSLASMTVDGFEVAVRAVDCTISSEVLVVSSPQTRFEEMLIECHAVDIPGVGHVEVKGSVVYMKQSLANQ